MIYIVLITIVIILFSIALYSFFKWRELQNEWDELTTDSQEKLVKISNENDLLRIQVKQLDRLAHIPDIIEKSKKLQEIIDLKIQDATAKAEEIIKKVKDDARSVRRKEIEDAEEHLEQVRSESERIHSDTTKRKEEIIYEAEQTALSITSNATFKSETRIRSQSVIKEAEEMLNSTILFCTNLKKGAELKAKEVAGDAFLAKNQFEFYEKAAQAMKNVIDGYGDAYLNNISTLLDDWANEYGYDKAAANLRGARDRTKLMIKLRHAATSDYVEVGRKEFATNFVLDAFNGKVDSILARLKPGNYIRLVQEIKDSFILVNVNGKGFRNSRITEEYLESRIDELKWAHSVQELRISQQEEQRAIREQMRDEQKAKREFDRAIKQARKEEERLEKALSLVRKEFENASMEQKSVFLSRIQELEGKLNETEGYIKRTQSLAEQTKQGHVYVISNIGSFGENIYKIGLTRRLNYMERVNELGDASVPFRFDVHASIWDEDAPALEYIMHKKLVNYQVNKVNRRKEFFKVSLADIRTIITDMGKTANWTMKAEAAEYYESVNIDNRLERDAEFRAKWTEEQLKIKFENSFDEDESIETVDQLA